MFQSKVNRGEVIIDDDYRIDSLLARPRGLTLQERTTPFGRMAGTSVFPKELLIPRSEWQARIQEMEERQSRVSDICKAAGLTVKFQDWTNFCWANAIVRLVEITRVVNNLPKVELSPSSIAGPIKNFRNVGGWGEEAIRFIIEKGVVPTAMYPNNTIESRYYTTAAKEAAKDYRITEWWELVPRNHDELISCLLRRIPVGIGLNWWGHEVTAVDPVWRNGEADIRIDNSWGPSWGDQGYGILAGTRKLADDAVCARVVVAA